MTCLGEGLVQPEGQVRLLVLLSGNGREARGRWQDVIGVSRAAVWAEEAHQDLVTHRQRGK